MPKQSILSFLEKVRYMRRSYVNKNGTTTGPCVICDEEQTLSFVDWKHHLLDHTSEKEFYCFECNSLLRTKAAHGKCSIESIGDIFDAQDNGALDGFVCKICGYFQINDSQLVRHLEEQHDGADVFFDGNVERVTLVPNMQSQSTIIETSMKFAPIDRQYQCGAGKCPFHGR